MSKPDIQIEFDGGDADRNVINMKYYALALQGAEEILSDGLIVLAYRRLPKPREQAPVLVKAREAIKGSHLTPTDLGEAYQMLQLGLPLLNDIGAEFLYNWVKAVIARFSGHPSDLETALGKLVELSNSHLEARDRNDERALEERRMMHDERVLFAQVVRDAIDALGNSAEKLAAPVGKGRSVSTAAISTRADRKVEINEVSAEAIRENNKVIWERVAPLDLETDGFKFHSNGLSVRNPEGEGYMMAVVKDPIFKDEDNAYTEAAQRRATIRVLARKGRRNGALARLEIIQFETIIDDKAA